MSAFVDYLILRNSSFYLKTLKKKPHKNCEPYFLLPSLPDWSQCWRVYTFRILYCGQITVCIDSYPLLRL